MRAAIRELEIGPRDEIADGARDRVWLRFGKARHPALGCIAMPPISSPLTSISPVWTPPRTSRSSERAAKRAHHCRNAWSEAFDGAKAARLAPAAGFRGGRGRPPSCWP